MKPKKIPMRMCVGCREMKPKRELIRVVRSPEGEVSMDATGKKPGRGAYLCRDAQCLKQAQKSRRLERAFSCKIPPEVYAKLEEEIQKAQQEAEKQAAPAGPVDEQGRPIIVIEDGEEPLPKRRGGGHG